MCGILHNTTTVSLSAVTTAIWRFTPIHTLHTVAQYSDREAQYWAPNINSCSVTTPSRKTFGIEHTYIRGVLKKRLNFLNSAPTSKESALRLLSAPSVKFWRQTTVCPVSLRALVVGLHKLNWARAQAIRRISDKVEVKELEERVCVCVCVCVREMLLQTW
jgi:hypothetical protein